MLDGPAGLRAPLSTGQAGNCPAAAQGAALLHCKHIWRRGRGRREGGEQKKRANTRISNNKPTKIVQLDRWCPKGRRFLRKHSMLASTTAGNMHKMFVFGVFGKLLLASSCSYTLCLLASSSQPEQFQEISDSSPPKALCSGAGRHNRQQRGAW